MSGAAIEGDDGIVGINVTPLVDVVLVLLVVLMVTARVVANDGVPMDLPKAATAGATMNVFAIAIDAEGHVSIDGKRVDTSEALRRQATAARERDPELRAVLQASRKVEHGDVVRVLDDLRSAGVSRVAFAAERSP